nr:TlyA family RNA methyltransferase [Bifidobacterium gallicum]
MGVGRQPADIGSGQAGGRASQGSGHQLRLDQALVRRGLVQSRSRAQRLIDEGRVFVDGKCVSKSSSKVDGAADIRVDKGDDYVSRGALKLVGAFDVFSSCDPALPEPAGLCCLDIGASTGGFTEVLLRRGARQVIALDVGHGQLAPRIASDPRVIEMSGTNVRDVTVEDLPFRPEMIVSDVSFISLTYVIPVIARIAAAGAPVVVLVKPQFEVGRGGLDRHGIVTDEVLRQEALDRVAACAQEHGLQVVATADSPIEGMHGNAEYLLYARCSREGRAGDGHTA